MYVAISAAGAFRSDDAGASWHVVTSGLNSNFLPEPEAPIRHCVHKLAMHPSRPDTVFMQKHWDVCRSDDAGDSWTEVSGNLPSDFGFPIAVHSHEPHTIFVVPIHSDSEHYPSEGKLRVFRNRSGDNEWEALTQGLPRGDRFTRPRTPAIPGRRSRSTCPECLRWRFRRSRDDGQGRPVSPPWDACTGRGRVEHSGRRTPDAHLRAGRSGVSLPDAEGHDP